MGGMRTSAAVTTDSPGRQRAGTNVAAMTALRPTGLKERHGTRHGADDDRGAAPFTRAALDYAAERRGQTLALLQVGATTAGDDLDAGRLRMAGCDVAWQMNEPLSIIIVSGMITGCAGGVLRDVLCNHVPLLFRSELYASVSVVTGLFYATAFGLKLDNELWTALTFVLGLTFRLLAIRYKWEMPKFVFNEDRE